LSYLSKSIDTLIESYSSKSESHPVKYYLRKSLKVFGFKYTYVSKVNVIAKIYLSNKSRSKIINHFKFLILSKADGSVFFLKCVDRQGTLQHSDVIYKRSICVQ
jgi:hypothetical protein